MVLLFLLENYTPKGGKPIGRQEKRRFALKKIRTFIRKAKKTTPLLESVLDELERIETIRNSLYEMIKERKSYDAYSSASGARTQPLMVIISTFGFFRDGIFDRIFDRAQKVLSGKSTERMLPVIFRIDDDDDPADSDCWIKANPGLGSHPTKRYLEDEWKKAVEDPEMMPSFLARHLNRATNAAVSYFDLKVINDSAIDISEQDYFNKYAIGGLDMAETTDLCCASCLIPGGGKLILSTSPWGVVESGPARQSKYMSKSKLPSDYARGLFNGIVGVDVIDYHWGG